TFVGICERWRALASWVPRFERDHAGRSLIGFGDDAKEGSRIGGVPSPYRAWAFAFRESTTATLALMRDKEDVAVHRFLQDLDNVLQGKAVHVGEHLRDADVLVRAALDRAVRKKAEAQQDGPIVAMVPQHDPPTSSQQPTAPQAEEKSAQAPYGTVNPHDLIQQKVAAAILGKKPPELSDWLRKIKDTAWVHPDWNGSKERFHYLLEQFAGGALLRSRIV